MKTRNSLPAALLVHGAALLCLASPVLKAQSPSPLRLKETILLPAVKGRIDHLAFDAEHRRLFVAALGNDTVEVIDLQAGKVVHTIGGLAEPQGVLYQPGKNRLWIANGGDGTVRIFDADTFQPLTSLPLGDDADNIRRDPATGRIYVGYGKGGIAVFDADARKVADIALDAHPESFQLEKNGARLFVNLPGSKKIAVIDRAKSRQVESWPTADALSNFPMAFDEAHARLFIVCRKPAVLLVLDTASGSLVARLPTVGDSDDVFFDPAHKRIYVSGGQGVVSIYRQDSPDRYTALAQVETVPGGRTSLFVPELNRLFVAVRQVGASPAAVRVYEAAE